MRFSLCAAFTFAAVAVGAVAVGNARAQSLGMDYAWGGNTYGQFGNDTTTGSNTPVPVPSFSSGNSAIACGISFSLVMQNGSVYAWRKNANGQLGDGNTTEVHTPVAVSNLTSGVSAIAGGDAFALAPKNGGVYAWGKNANGQLGDGTTGEEKIPEQIDPTDLNTIVEVAPGEIYSYALSSDGSLWVWGGNTDGELGLGTSTTDYLTPQHLLPPTGYEYTSIAANNDGNTMQAIPGPATLGLIGLAATGLMGRGRGPDPRNGCNRDF